MNDAGVFDIEESGDIRERIFSAVFPGKIQQDIELRAGQSMFFEFLVKTGFQLVVYFFEIDPQFVHANVPFYVARYIIYQNYEIVNMKLSMKKMVMENQNVKNKIIAQPMPRVVIYLCKSQRWTSIYS